MAAGISAKHLYREAMEQVHSYNSKLLLDRRLRMPYIDNQTGLAQQDCHLWVSRVQRCAPMRKGQIYSYPSRRWMVRKRPDFVGSSKVVEKKSAPEVEDTSNNSQDVVQEGESKSSESVKAEDAPAIPAIVETPVAIATSAYVDDFYDDEAFDSEFDSDEEFGSRKKKRKTARNSRSSNKKSSSNANNMSLKFGSGDGKWKVGKVGGEDMYNKPIVEEKKKFYDCQFCNKRYKNQQSLRYHYEHHNHNLQGGDQPPQIPVSNANVPAASSTPTNNSNETEVPSQPPTDQPPHNHVSGAKRKKGMPPSSYCDFCLGSVSINKKSGSSEELISCADCGRSGHPSCLQFNENLTGQVKKYKWQCIECKSCCICGTSDNDEQLLFCDDCDRGYHMYCLSPPIAEPPEGSWQCQLCEARVKGRDISKVAVLPQHMDIAFVQATMGMSESVVGVSTCAQGPSSAQTQQVNVTTIQSSLPTSVDPSVATGLNVSEQVTGMNPAQGPEHAPNVPADQNTAKPVTLEESGVSSVIKSTVAHSAEPNADTTTTSSAAVPKSVSTTEPEVSA